MKLRMKLTALMLCAITVFTAMAQTPNGPRRDPLGALKRAISEANAPALTTDQETQLNTLITAYKDALPDEPDAALEAARDAFDAAVLAGNLTAAQAQATIIANRTAELTNNKLRAEAVFEIGVLALLKNGGQLDPLVTKFGADRVLGLVDSLIGRSFGGGRH
jgi:Spy/CpxP family protein refolding chaperone